MATKAVVTKPTTPTATKAVGTTTKPVVTPVASKPNADQLNWFNQYSNNRTDGKGQTAERDAYYNTLASKYGLTQVNAPTATTSTKPGYTAPDPFSFNYNYLNYDTAKGQAEQQFNPLFEQAVGGVKAQQYQNELDSGQSSAVRGLAHSGLAQDALTKIAIASQGQIAGLNAQKMSDVAKMAQQLVQQDQMRGDALRSQAFNEYQSNRDFGYGQYRDTVGDNQWQTQFDYNKGRDSVADKQWQTQFDYTKGQDKLNRYDSNYWNKVNQNNITRDYNRSVLESDREWNQMSPAEKQRAALDLANSMKLKGASGGGGGGRRGSTSSKSSKNTPSPPNTGKPKTTVNLNTQFMKPNASSLAAFRKQYITEDPEQYYKDLAEWQKEQAKKKK